jgi:hypothetical protein
MVSNPATPSQQEKSIAKNIPVYSDLYTLDSYLLKLLLLLLYLFLSYQGVADRQHHSGREGASFGYYDLLKASGTAHCESMQNLPDKITYRVYLLTRLFGSPDYKINQIISKTR